MDQMQCKLEEIKRASEFNEILECISSGEVCDLHHKLEGLFDEKFKMIHGIIKEIEQKKETQIKSYRTMNIDDAYAILEGKICCSKSKLEYFKNAMKKGEVHEPIRKDIIIEFEGKLEKMGFVFKLLTSKCETIKTLARWVSKMISSKVLILENIWGLSKRVSREFEGKDD